MAATQSMTADLEHLVLASKQVREQQHPEECPLVAAANEAARGPGARALAAAAAWALARDPRAVDALAAVAARLTATERLEVQQIAPDLLEPMPDYYLFQRPEVLALVPPTATSILEIGCAAGRLGEAVKRRQDCCYTGVELDPHVAALAANALDRVECLDLDRCPDLPFPPGTFDCVVAADVLEHLKDPWHLLRLVRGVLRPHGRLVVSIPNIRNLGVMAQLAAGDWAYQDAGILDRTHLRFFTLRSFARALGESGFEIDHISAVPDATLAGAMTQEAGGWRADWGSLHLTDLTVQDTMELAAVQYLFTATPR